MRFGTRVWSLGKLLVLIGALGATFLIFFGISVRVALRAQEVDVPTLTGRTLADATAALTVLGLGVRVDDALRADDRVPAGRIAKQDPPAGRQTRRERTVKLWVSSGPRTSAVPALTGQVERLAQIRLRQDGLEVATVSEIRSSEYATDAVVAQDPPAASRAPQVSLLINRGEQAIVYVMPDLTGMDGAAAAEALQARGFRVNIGTTAPALPIQPGMVQPGSVQPGSVQPGSVAPGGTPPGSVLPGSPVPGSVQAGGAAPGSVVGQRPAAGYPVSAAEPVSLEVNR
jgi:serine/threonine-protein kinase